MTIIELSATIGLFVLLRVCLGNFRELANDRGKAETEPCMRGGSVGWDSCGQPPSLKLGADYALNFADVGA